MKQDALDGTSTECPCWKQPHWAGKHPVKARQCPVCKLWTMKERSKK